MLLDGGTSIKDGALNFLKYLFRNFFDVREHYKTEKLHVWTLFTQYSVDTWKYSLSIPVFKPISNLKPETYSSVSKILTLTLTLFHHLL